MTPAILVIPVLGLLVGVLALRAIAQERQQNAGVVPIAIFSLMVVVADTQVSEMVLGESAKRLMQMLAGAVIAFGAGVLPTAARHSARRPLTTTALLILLLGAWLLVVDLVAAGPSLAVFTGRLIALGVLAALVLMAMAGHLKLSSVQAAIALAFAWAALLTAVTPEPLRACSLFKCGPLGGQVTGPFFNENEFAALAMLAMLAGLSSRDRWLRAALIVSSAYVLFATHSRNAQIATAAALMVAFVWSRRGSLLVSLRPLIAVLLPTSSALLGLHLVYTADRADFSNRGSIWKYGTDAVSDSWAFGNGLDSWSVDVLERNYMHSEYLMLLYSGGLVAVMLFVLMSASALSRARGTDGWFVLAFLSGFLVNGLVQIPWNPISLEGGVMFTLVLIAIAFHTGIEGELGSSEARSGEDRTSQAQRPSWKHREAREIGSTDRDVGC